MWRLSERSLLMADERVLVWSGGSGTFGTGTVDELSLTGKWLPLPVGAI